MAEAVGVLTDDGKVVRDVKSLDDVIKLSVQSEVRGEPEVAAGLSILMYMSQQIDLVAPWWSKQRDKNLLEFLGRCDFVLGAYYTVAAKLAAVPFRIEPVDKSVQSDWKTAEQYQGMLVEGSDFFRGWEEFFTRWMLSRWIQDNGVFTEVIGAGPADGPIKGAPVGLALLDPWRCTRTGVPEYPVIYQDVSGKRYKLHHTRVIYGAQLPSTAAEMHGVGYCATTRVLSIAQGLVDVLRYKGEKLGSRPWRGIIYGSGVDGSELSTAVRMANESADAAGMGRFAKTPFVVSKTKAVDLNVLDLASLPDGFDYEKDVTLGMYAIALALGVPPRWIWPATQTGATKADAMYQHLAGTQSGPAYELRVIRNLLGGAPHGMSGALARFRPQRFLPPNLTMVFDLQDDEQDMMAADIRAKRADAREKDLASAITTIRVIREQMLADGELTEAQFVDLELGDGRLEDGSDVRMLVYTDNPYVQNLDTEDRAALEDKLTEAQKGYVQAKDSQAKAEAQAAIACLDAYLEDLGSERETEGEETVGGSTEEGEAGEGSEQLLEGMSEEELEKAVKQAKPPSTRHPKKNRDGAADYDSRLRAIYDDWAEEAAAKLEGIDDPDEREKALAALLLLLAARLKRAGRDGLQEAFELGLGGDVPDEEAMAALDAAIAKNDRYVDTSFIPAARERFYKEAGVPGFAWQGEALLAALSALAWRTALYVGAFWAAIGLGLAAGLRRRDNPVRRFLDPVAAHCDTCPPKEAEYPSWDEMVAVAGIPGDGSDDCGGRCKCGVEEKVNGVWVGRL